MSGEIEDAAAAAWAIPARSGRRSPGALARAWRGRARRGRGGAQSCWPGIAPRQSTGGGRRRGSGGGASPCTRRAGGEGEGGEGEGGAGGGLSGAGPRPFRAGRGGAAARHASDQRVGSIGALFLAAFRPLQGNKKPNDPHRLALPCNRSEGPDVYVCVCHAPAAQPVKNVVRKERKQRTQTRDGRRTAQGPHLHEQDFGRTIRGTGEGMGLQRSSLKFFLDDRNEPDFSLPCRAISLIEHKTLAGGLYTAKG